MIVICVEGASAPPAGVRTTFDDGALPQYTSLRFAPIIRLAIKYGQPVRRIECSTPRPCSYPCQSRPPSPPHLPCHCRSTRHPRCASASSASRQTRPRCRATHSSAPQSSLRDKQDQHGDVIEDQTPGDGKHSPSSGSLISSSSAISVALDISSTAMTTSTVLSKPT